ncbi:MAG: hypothetical protein ABIO72_02650 [Patescibacteria group bacterium]
MWLFEMLEDGEPSDDWPAITFRLDTFGQLIKREVKLHEIPIGFRISAQERPIIPGMEWVAKPMSWPVGEGPPEQTWAAMRIGLGPTCITYSICREKKHIHIEETRAEGRRTARLVGTAVCTTNHKEHVERIAVELDQLPPTTQQILAEIDSKSGVPGFVRRVLASLGL